MKRFQTTSWKPVFQQHIGAINPPTFALATTSTFHHIPINGGAQSVTPRCRTMIYRGFLADIPPNKYNPLESHNPRDVFKSDALTFTTDSRMTKTREILPLHAFGGDAEVKTAGGGFVEAVFWIAGDTTTGKSIQNQWRFRGKCYLLAEEDVDGVSEVTDVLRKSMIPTGKEGGDKWSWKKEVQAHFGNLSPALRGSFANPPPGTPLSTPLSEMCGAKSGGGLVKGNKISNDDVMATDGLAAIARRNMRVGVIIPEFVERLDLAEDDGKARRWVWSKVGEEEGDVEGVEGMEDGWRMEETWP